MKKLFIALLLTLPCLTFAQQSNFTFVTKSADSLNKAINIVTPLLNLYDNTISIDSTADYEFHSYVNILQIDPTASFTYTVQYTYNNFTTTLVNNYVVNATTSKNSHYAPSDCRFDKGGKIRFIIVGRQAGNVIINHGYWLRFVM